MAISSTTAPLRAPGMVPAGASHAINFTATMGVGGVIRGIATIRTAANQTTQSFNRMTHSARGFANIRWGNIFGLSTSLIALGTVIDRFSGKITSVFKGWIEVAGEFEKKLTELEVVAGTTTANLAKMREVALKLGIETIFPPSEVLNTMTSLAAAGLDYTQTMAALPAVLDLVAASMGRLDLAQGAKIGIAAMTKFKLKPDEIEPFMNQMTRLGQITNLRPEGFLPFIEALGSSMQQLQNTPREQILAVGAMLRNVGMSEQRAGRSMALFVTGLQQLGKEGLKLPGARGKRMQGFGLLGLDESALKDAHGDFLPILDIITNIGEAANKQGLSVDKLGQAMQIAFPAKNARDLVTLTVNLGEVWDETTKSWVRGAQALAVTAKELARVRTEMGFTHDLAGKFLGTWQGLQALWKGSKETFGVLMGEGPLPFLTKGGNVLLAVFNRFLDLLKAWPELRGAFATATLALGAFVKVAGVALIVMGSLIGVILLLGLALTQLPVVLLGVAALWATWSLGLSALATKLFVFASTLGVVALAARSFGEAWQRASLLPFDPTKATGFFEGLAAAFEVVKGSLSGEGAGMEFWTKLDEHPFLYNLARSLSVWGFMVKDVWGVIKNADYSRIQTALEDLGDALIHVIDAFGHLFGIDDPFGPEGAQVQSRIEGYAARFRWAAEVFATGLDKLTRSIEAYAAENAALPVGSMPKSPLGSILQLPDITGGLKTLLWGGVIAGIAKVVSLVVAAVLSALGITTVGWIPLAITAVGAVVGGILGISGLSKMTQTPLLTEFGEETVRRMRQGPPGPLEGRPSLGEALSSFRETSSVPPDPLASLYSQAYGPRKARPGAATTPGRRSGRGREIRGGSPGSVSVNFGGVTINAKTLGEEEARRFVALVAEKLETELSGGLMCGYN